MPHRFRNRLGLYAGAVLCARAGEVFRSLQPDEAGVSKYLAHRRHGLRYYCRIPLLCQSSARASMLENLTHMQE